LLQFGGRGDVVERRCSAPACWRRSRTGAATASASWRTGWRRWSRSCRRPRATGCTARCRCSTAG